MEERISNCDVVLSDSLHQTVCFACKLPSTLAFEVKKHVLAFKKVQLIMFRLSGYMSTRTIFILNNWIEFGEYQKVEILARQVDSWHNFLHYSMVFI